MTDTYSAIQATMLNDVNRLKIISQNLANVTTAGYKKQVAVSRSFSELIAMANSANNPINGQRGAIEQHLPYIDVVSDPSMGTVKYTGSRFDIVAGNNTYFSVLTPHGVAYTKQGSFSKNSAGVMVNPQGYPVLGEQGEIHLNAEEPVIDTDGNISVRGKAIDKLKTVTFKAGSNLTPIGFGLYARAEDTQEDQAQPGSIRQGYLEMSNVTVMEEMVKMIETVRHFEAAQKYMMGYDDMLDNAINIIGEL